MTTVWELDQTDILQCHLIPSTDCIIADSTEKECYWSQPVYYCQWTYSSNFMGEKIKMKKIQGACGCSKVNDADLVPLCQKVSARAVCSSDQDTEK